MHCLMHLDQIKSVVIRFLGCILVSLILRSRIQDGRLTDADGYFEGGAPQSSFIRSFVPDRLVNRPGLWLITK